MSNPFGYDDYVASLRIEAQANGICGQAGLDDPFYAMLMACLRVADSSNLVLLRQAFPAVVDEFITRYHSPHGLLPGERVIDPDGQVYIREKTGELRIEGKVRDGDFDAELERDDEKED